MEPIVGSDVRSLNERVRSVDGSVVRRMNPSRSRLVETVAPSGLWVPPAYANALGSRLRRAARPFGAAALSLAMLVSCGEVNQPPPDPDPDPDPVCEVNPIEQVALDAGVPFEWVSVLGEDCEVDADERWFVSEFLPELRERTTDRIAKTYPERFVEDDGAFKADERLVLSRYFEGRRNHEGVKINPGYFELFDANKANPETRLEIANASWVPLFATPFANRVIPGYQNNGYGEPYYEDGGMESVNALYLPNHGEEVSFLDLLGSALQPQPDVTLTDVGSSSQFVFAQDQALVVDAPHAMRVNRIQELENYGLDGTMVRNATLYLSPVASRSASLGFSDLETFVVHADLNRLLVEEDDIVLPEQVLGYSELRLGGGIMVKWGMYSQDGHIGDGSHWTVIDPYDPSIDRPESRGLIPEAALYRNVDSDGNPTQIYLGVFQRTAVKDGRAMALDGVWDPLVWTRP